MARLLARVMATPIHVAAFVAYTRATMPRRHRTPRG
jgi:hypothetical protein